MFDRYPNTQSRHKVFVSYHHARDQAYRDRFERLFAYDHDIMVSKSVQIGDIPTYLSTETVRQKIRDEYLRDSTVTVVLIGAETWQRKHADWEIASSIRHTEFNPRSGLLGILLPSYQRPSLASTNQTPSRPASTTTSNVSLPAFMTGARIRRRSALGFTKRFFVVTRSFLTIHFRPLPRIGLATDGSDSFWGRRPQADH
jgi:hypothetical protein